MGPMFRGAYLERWAQAPKQRYGVRRIRLLSRYSPYQVFAGHIYQGPLGVPNYCANFPVQVSALYQKAPTICH